MLFVKFNDWRDICKTLISYFEIDTIDILDYVMADFLHFTTKMKKKELYIIYI